MAAATAFADLGFGRKQKTFKSWIDVDEKNQTRQTEWYYYEVLTSEEVSWKGLSTYQLTWVGQTEILGDIIHAKEIYFDDDGWKYSVRGEALESVFSVYIAQLEAIINMFSIFQ